MRSDLIYAALGPVQNRYTLCQLASKATRKFHRPATRIQETMNNVFTRVAKSPRESVVSERQTYVAEPQRRLPFRTGLGQQHVLAIAGYWAVERR